jgi:hypothetical protein
LHAANPVAVWKFPAAQLVHVPAPDDPEYAPAGHSLQLAEFENENVPAAQLVQAPAPLVEYVPGAQLV